MKKDAWPQNHSDVCIRCATCMTVCPVARVTPLFPGPKQAGPGAQRFRKPDEPSTDEWIDLCIGCQLCDMVCAAGVNISELNLMAKAKYLEEKGRPFRDWFLTHTHLFGSLASHFSAIFNSILKNKAVRWLMDAVLKIDRRRELPGYESPTFRQWFREHRSQGQNKIAYFYGCFTNTNEVDVGKATVEVLEAHGFEVTLPSQECCGIPLLGIGNFKEARQMGLRNVPSLLEAVRSNLNIVYSSTSCGHMLKYEYSHLLKIPGAEEMAPHLFDLFEFLRNLKESGPLQIRVKKLPARVAYFAPCHLRALGIGFPALEILRLIPGLTVDNVEADCCGLGGTFGFKKEKYDISQEIGKDLAEAIGRMKPEIVLSDCEGCRMQIRHLTGLKVLHPVQLLRDALTGKMLE
ncbi:MAG TPA: anaerobic glycerol-3-phosphate dehydrogenase subunit C [Thermodesulfobacteriota bacterium]|nr:anaerobic glycerol-3-phosphate dehydrogenase subunit C [Thermodesulfobacteriota bacterium]